MLRQPRHLRQGHMRALVGPSCPQRATSKPSAPTVPQRQGQCPLEARRASCHSCSASGQAAQPAQSTEDGLRPRSKRRAVRELAGSLTASGCSLLAQLRWVWVLLLQALASPLAHTAPRARSAPAWQQCLHSASVMLVPALSRGTWQNLTSNHVFLVGFWAWLTAQTMKVCALCCSPCARLPTAAEQPVAQIFTKKVKKGVWDIKAVVDSGGMPSSHSSLCMVSWLCCLWLKHA